MMDFLITRGNFILQLLPLSVIVFAIIYFLIIRPRKKRIKRHEEMVLSNVRKQDSQQGDSKREDENNPGVYDGSRVIVSVYGSRPCVKCGTLCQGFHSTGRWVAIGLLSFFLFPIGLFSFLLLLGRKNYRCLKCGSQFRV